MTYSLDWTVEKKCIPRACEAAPPDRTYLWLFERENQTRNTGIDSLRSRSKQTRTVLHEITVNAVISAMHRDRTETSFAYHDRLHCAIVSPGLVVALKSEEPQNEFRGVDGRQDQHGQLGWRRCKAISS